MACVQEAGVRQQADAVAPTAAAHYVPRAELAV
jgi:hypothetical protein